ncbi:BRCA1-associated protein 2-domain-containing protein [Fennellomyces sp. T-0311]|nr:BRCA1-associated protein 2-domain-containing protein [Fennellomyces sp. T-0311]
MERETQTIFNAVTQKRQSFFSLFFSLYDMPLQPRSTLELAGFVVQLPDQPDYGVLHLYRGNETLSPPASASQPLSKSTIVCSLDVPSYLSVPDFMSFVEPVDSFVSHYRIIRETDPDKYMVLMKFRDTQAAQDYHGQYNGRRFSSMEPETCRIVYIQSVEMNSVQIPPYTFPFVNDTALRRADDDTPICSVCLERMDEKVTGLLTILCQHTFHCKCLHKWGDGSCPVCRYSQKPTASADEEPQETHPEEKQWSYREANECSTCGSNANLWICLICGFIGCEQSAHALEHSNNSNHPYALEIETQRVWDFAGNGYVHRLIQNMVDGKLVELPGTSSSTPPVSQEKLEAMSLEYSYLMTSQLDSQRIYYEDFLDQATRQLSALTKQAKGLAKDLQNLDQEKEALGIRCAEATTSLKEAQQDKDRVDQSLLEYKARYEVSRRQLTKEKETTNSLLKENELLQKTIEQRQQMVKELSDQVRDLKFFLEAREKVQEHPELGGGSVGTRSSSARKTKRGAKR